MTESPYVIRAKLDQIGYDGERKAAARRSSDGCYAPIRVERKARHMNDTNARPQPTDLGEPYCCTNHYGPCHKCLNTGHAHDPAARCPAQEAVSDAPYGWDEKTQSPVDEQAESLIDADPPEEPDTVIAECECWLTPEWQWTKHYSAVEPGSQWEPNPDCPVHFPRSVRLSGAPDTTGEGF